MNGSYQMEQVDATCRSSANDLKIYVDDAIWEREITSRDILELETRLHSTTPEGSVRPEAGIMEIERELFQKEATPITLLLTQSDAQFEGFFTPTDLLPDSEARQYGTRSNEQAMVHLNAVRAKDRLGPVFSHEVQHLFHFQHDQDEEVWMRELLAQGAMNLTGQRDFELERQSRVHPTAPLVTDDNEMANYPGLTSFAAHLQRRFGTEILARLNRHPANGIDSVNQVLGEMGTDATFESVLKDHFVERARATREEVGKTLERFRVKDHGGILSLRTRPGGADFIHLDNSVPLKLEVTDRQEGMFIEQLRFDKNEVRRTPIEVDSGPVILEGAEGHFLMVGSAKPDGVVKLAFSPD